MTEALFLQDAYMAEVEARVSTITEAGGLILDRSVFYPTGGGQPGDQGHLTWGNEQCRIANTTKGEAQSIVLHPAEGQSRPPAGAGPPGRHPTPRAGCRRASCPSRAQ